MVAIEFKTELEMYLKYCQNQLNSAIYNDQKSYYEKAIKLTEKQIELVNAGWDEIDIAKVSYIISRNVG